MHPFISETPGQLYAKAQEYDRRGLKALAESCRKQAAYVAKRNKRSGRRV